MNVYELNTQPRNPTNNFTLKYCLFDTVKLIRNVDKSEFTYNGRGIAFDGKGHWSFEKKTARNDIFFGAIILHYLVLIIQKITFQYQLRDQLKVQLQCWCNRKKNVLTLVKQIQSFALSLHCNGDESYLYVNKTQIYKLELNDNISW